MSNQKKEQRITRAVPKTTKADGKKKRQLKAIEKVLLPEREEDRFVDLQSSLIAQREANLITQRANARLQGGPVKLKRIPNLSDLSKKFDDLSKQMDDAKLRIAILELELQTVGKKDETRMKNSYYLSVDMKTGEPKVGKRQPKPTFGVAVFELELDIPEGWNKPIGTIELQLPGPPDESIINIRDALGLDKDDDEE